MGCSPAVSLKPGHGLQPAVLLEPGHSGQQYSANIYDREKYLPWGGEEDSDLTTPVLLNALVSGKEYNFVHNQISLLQVLTPL